MPAPGDGGGIADEAGELAAELERQRTFEASLHPRTGSILLGEGDFRITLPAHLAYLEAPETERVLIEWGNPPGSETLGMIYPSATSLFDPASFAVILSYEKEGHVSDEDASEIDYADLLRRMQADTRSENAARTRAGIETVELRDWAEPPRYDARAHVLYWAKDLKFASSETGTLNYAVRLLGREGVFQMNAVTDISKLAETRTMMRELMSAAAFTEGNRYADFDESSDRVAEYGIAALIAGGVAQKAGFFKLLLGALAAGKKLVIFVVLGIAAVAKKLFGGKRDDQTS